MTAQDVLRQPAGRFVLLLCLLGVLVSGAEAETALGSSAAVPTVLRTIVYCDTPCRRSSSNPTVRFYWGTHPNDGAILTFVWRAPGGRNSYPSRAVWHEQPGVAGYETGLPHLYLLANPPGVWRVSLAVDGSTLKTVSVHVSA